MRNLPMLKLGRLDDNIRFRFAVSLLATLFRGFFTLTADFLFARFLGANSFGDYAFLVSTFLAVSILLDCGSSSAFYTFLSGRKQNELSIKRYFGWMAFQFALVAFFLLALMPTSLLDLIWARQGRINIFLAFSAIFLQKQLIPSLLAIGEACRRTTLVQGISVMLAGSSCVAAFGVFYLSSTSVTTALALLNVSYVVILVYAFVQVKGIIRSEATEEGIAPLEWRAEWRGYLIFCAPLFISSLITFAGGFYSRWVLQTFGGSSQQAQFAIAQQIANVCIIPIVAVSRIFWKEVAELQAAGNISSSKDLFVKTSSIMFGLACVSCGILLSWYELIPTYLFNFQLDDYRAFQIMLLFPIHQSLGQLLAIMYQATNQTARYGKVLNIMSVFGITLVTIFVIPSSSWGVGFGWGALGLAVASVLTQFVSVHVLWINLRLKNGFSKLCEQALLCLGIWLLGLCSRMVGEALSSHLLLQLVLSCLFYFGIILITFLKHPEIFGIERREIVSLIQYAKRLKS